jgi:hypothetical protein
MNLQEYIRYNEVASELIRLIEVHLDELDTVKARLALANDLLDDIEFKIACNGDIDRGEKAGYLEALKNYKKGLK